MEMSSFWRIFFSTSYTDPYYYHNSTSDASRWRKFGQNDGISVTMLFDHNKICIVYITIEKSTQADIPVNTQQKQIWDRYQVHKNNGDVHIMSNYRPISVIGHIAKMVEQLVRFQLVAYLEEHAFISTDQPAYLKGHSTQTSLHRVIDDWLENIDDNQTTGVCLLDISECFDTISHHILRQKLRMYGIKNTELEWFSSYLSNRKQAALCHNELSSSVDITTGVPQGSVLGPFLFLLFINDISNFTTDDCVTNLFADDAMIYASGDSVNEVNLKLQNCLNNISACIERIDWELIATNLRLCLSEVRLNWSH